MLEAAGVLAKMIPQLQVLHLTGGKLAAQLQEQYQQAGLVHRLLEFEPEMQYVYSLADLAISRAGGTTLAELAFHTVPAVLIPFPQARDNHQYLNARLVAEAGGALLLEQESISGGLLGEIAASLLEDKERLSQMAQAMRAFSFPHAAGVVARLIIEEMRC
jgi:UDP-N-acetylglucosamine:LPS N-acetylglucosamine transferase